MGNPGKNPYRLAALWAAIFAVTASVIEYIPIIYARRHHLEMFQLPLGYRLMDHVGESLVVAVPGTIIYAAMLTVVWIWVQMLDAWSAFLRHWQITHGLNHSGFTDFSELFSFNFSGWWMLPVVWLFYFALFSIFVRIYRAGVGQSKAGNSVEGTEEFR